MIDVFPETADRYLDFNTLEQQRQLRKWHVEELKEKMEKGLFRFGEIAFCKIKNDGFDVMVNGQHICHAIAQRTQPVPCVIEKYQVDGERERSELFRQFEILPRGLPEMVKVEAGALDITWPNWIANLVVSAIGIDIRKNKSGIIDSAHSRGLGPKETHMEGPSVATKEQRVTALRYYIQEGDFIFKILTQDKPSESTRKTVRHIARAAVAYMMMETWRKNKNMARRFWEQVRDGEGLGKSDATKSLREFLIESSGRKYSMAYSAPNNHQYIYRAAVAWNAFIEGRKTSLRYRPELQPPPLKAWSKGTEKT